MLFYSFEIQTNKKKIISKDIGIKSQPKKARNFTLKLKDLKNIAKENCNRIFIIIIIGGIGPFFLVINFIKKVFLFRPHFLSVPYMVSKSLSLALLLR